MKIDKLKQLLKSFNENLDFEHDLKKKNWFNIGGKSKVFFKPQSLKDLVEFLKIINNQEKIFILGAGSNILIPDGTFDGVVIKLGKNFGNISKHSENLIIAGSSTTDKALSEFAMENSISGFEFLSCIPGSVGGGIKMNAGCFDREFKDILVSVQAIDKKGNVVTIPKKNINFEYRRSNLSDDLIFLSATLKGEIGKSEIIKKKMLALKDRKEKTQPTKIKTSGSTFKNPLDQTNKKVWEIIKESVPSDINFGDACISEKHCNFFVNKGNATYEDMKNLIEFVSDSVMKKTGIKLEKEIKILE
tara:strand:- start:1417 stop:2325 length:909 start_codon:yes stop_codon:yes gene_type:complete